MDKKKSKGFTLVEVMSVIGIIAVLAGIIIVGISSFQSTSRDARRLSDLRKLKGVLELYTFKNNHYPGFDPSAPLPSANKLYWISDDNPGNDSGSTGDCLNSTGGLKTYIPDICNFQGPNDGGSCSVGTDCYIYAVKTDGTYKLGAKFENASYRAAAEFTYGSGPLPTQHPVHTYYEPKSL